MTDFERVKASCLQNNVLWEDPDFHAVQTSAFYHQTPPFNFKWKRAKEIYTNPKFIIDNQEAFDVIPGNLGDKWLVSCLAVLYLNKGLLYRVVPANQKIEEEYCGLFRFRLWWCGRWVEVMVDDRLPTVNGKLVFVQSSTTEQLWPALLEKAYAKLHGSYEALKYGSLLDGLSDLTGGITEMLPMADVTPAILKAALGNTTVVTAYLNSKFVDKVPLQPEMNYKITSIEEVNTFGEPMAVVRLRRPLAPGETDITNVVLTPSLVRYIPSHERDRITTPNKGFWVPFNDFVKLFERIEMVHLDAETSHAENTLEKKQQWFMTVHHGGWRRGVTAGGCRNYTFFFHSNPQIQIQLDEDDTVVISMYQHVVMEPKVIGFTIYKVPKAFAELAPSFLLKSIRNSANSQYINSRQITHRWELDAGTYLIIPTTFDPREEAKFSVRVFSLKKLRMSVLDVKAKMRKPAIVKAPPEDDVETFGQYEAVFMQLADEQKTIDIFELQELLEACLPNDYIRSCASIDTCRQILLTMDTKGMGRITIDDFKDLMCSLKHWHLVFKTHTREKMGVLRAERLRDALREIGFTLPERAMNLIMVRYMRKDGMLRFGDFVSVVMHLSRIFDNYDLHNAQRTIMHMVLGKVGKEAEQGPPCMNLSQWVVNALSC